MPVTARLSRRFYEQFGDEVTNELVDWFNSVDVTYQTSLRELNEINFARFDAKLEQRIAGLESRLEQRIAGVKSGLEQRIAGVESGSRQRAASLESALGARIDILGGAIDLLVAQQRELTNRLAASESRLLRWMITLWSSTILAMAGLIIAVLQRG
jgi:hypothetical protein